ncbi:MAG: flagellar hook-associated protein FlgK, partial [Selenomonadaceae bacterium]|nr:flagellar hook-associated protein FlgK [Selenomonadaceae bacterium]
MRATFSGLNTMVKGIFSNQLSLDTTGHNITNAGTEGYSRQGVNLAATRGQQQSSLYGEVLVGTGVDSMSIERARNFYADLQYWSESSTKKYYETLHVNYDKVETVFNDSDDSGIQNSMEEFYSSWVNLSTNATDSAARVAVVEKGKTFSDAIQTAATLMKDQINAEYDDMKLNLTKFNDLSKQVTVLNKSILVMEAGGAKANDLRDQRDLIVDKMSEYINLNVYEDEMGRYTVVSNGITLVHGDNHMDLKMSEPAFNRAYATNDYSLEVADTGIVFQPTNGYFKAKLDNVAINKSYIDDLSNMAAQLLTVFNDQHKLGVGVDNASTTGLNFFGQNTGPEGYKFTPSGGSEVECNMTVYAWDDENRCLVVTPAYKKITYEDKEGNPSESAVVNGNITVEYELTNEKDQVTA